MTNLEVILTPAEFAALAQRDLSQACCIVFDVLRATTSMVTALANGANGIAAVAEIPEALALRRSNPEFLLAGERDGLRIPAHLADGVAFDLGNSPREFTAAAVRGRLIAMTTTNGTRALRACAGARTLLAASFLNLAKTAEFAAQTNPTSLILVCSGTYDQAAYEDVLAAGAFCDLLWPRAHGALVADSAYLARRLYLLEAPNLLQAVSQSRNGRRLLNHPTLQADVAYSLQRDTLQLLARRDSAGLITRA